MSAPVTVVRDNVLALKFSRARKLIQNETRCSLFWRKWTKLVFLDLRSGRLYGKIATLLLFVSR